MRASYFALQLPMSKDWTEQYNHIISGNPRDVEEEFDLFYKLSEIDIPLDTEQAWNRLENKIQATSQKSFFIFALKIAATVLLVFSALFAVFQSNFNFTDELVRLESTETNQLFTLPDGSSVTLVSTGYIEYQLDESRNIHFEGDGFFEITKGAVPFTIQTPQAEIIVLGTSFSLNTENRLDLAVMEGLVSLKTDHEARKVKQGEHAILGTSGITIQEIKDPNQYSWKTGEFTFQDIKLKETFPYLEKYYNKTFISNEALGNCRISISFKSKSLEEVTEVIASILNAKSEISSTEVNFSGAGCN